MFKEFVKRIGEIWSWADYNKFFADLYDEYHRETISWEELQLLAKAVENVSIHAW